MSADAAFDYSDEERVTVISQALPDSLAPVQSLVLSDKSEVVALKQPQETLYYTNEIEVNGKLMRFDANQLKNEEGCLKVLEFIVIAVALLLSGNVHGVSGERGFALFVCFVAFMLAFSIALAKVLTLNYLVDSKLWSLLELSIYIALGVAFTIAAGLMTILCFLHWVENNPDWEVIPGLATFALAMAAIVFFVDAGLTFYNRRYRSWSPTKGASL